MLDPSNPRFKFDLKELLAEESGLEKQAEVLASFDTTPPKKEDDESDGINSTNIKDLYDSMNEIGYAPIDQIVVKPVLGGDKYLVIEGNRRVATIKTILKDIEDKKGYYSKLVHRAKGEKRKNEFKSIPCVMIETEGQSEEDIERQINVVLGLRHHGSLLEWVPSPRS